MNRITRAALGLAALTLVLCAGAVRADNYPVKDAFGAVRSFCSKAVGSVETPCQNTTTTGVSYGASGVTPVSATATAVGTSASLTPLAGRPFNIAFSGTGTFSIQLERQLGGVWFPLSSGAGTQRFAWSTAGTQTVAASEAVTETEAGVAYRWRITACTACSITYRLEQ